MSDRLDELIAEYKSTPQPDLTKLDDFKEHISNLNNGDFTSHFEKFVIKLTSIMDKVSDQDNHLNCYLNEKIKRGYAGENDRKQLLSEFKEAIKETQKTIDRRILSAIRFADVTDDLPVPVSLGIPEDYILDKEHGIIKIAPDGRKILVCPYIVLPVQIVVDSSDTSGDKLCRIIRWNKAQNKWQYHPYQISMKHIQDPNEITRLNGAGVIAIGKKYNKGLAEFMVDFINENNMLVNLPTNVAVHSCGWTEEGLFFPYTTQEKGEDLIFTGKQGTTAYAIKQAAEKLPVGSMDEAKNIINILSDNAVFAIMLAGCLSAPLVTKMNPILKENIGIDLYGKTTSGKTTIQVLAATLVYGLGDELKSSWSKATIGGIWRKAEAVNNLPFLMDDSHVIVEKLSGVPHDLINRKEGDKSTKIAENSWGSKDNTNDQYVGVVMFNGEIPISSKAPLDSAGIYGRVLMINHPPFPSYYNYNAVEQLKDSVESNKGHFAKPWIEFISQIDDKELKREVSQIGEQFHDEDADDLYGRLITKASLLVWSLKKFNEQFGTPIDTDKAINLLKKSMKSMTNQVNVADQLMQQIIDAIWEKACTHTPNENGQILLNFDGEFMGNPNICYKIGEALIIHQTIIKKILNKKDDNELKPIKQTLVSAEYLRDPKPKNHRFAPTERYRGNESRIFGLLFKYEDIKEFIPTEEDEFLWSKKPVTV
ncbi:DNA/RNA helicase, superfamily II [Schinkia azotoformans MEV2011]|uniref:DNA/RNA helicase, superfamily II n=1 Tax=Schinkia azotoformans MEV2011 TaxID=1348973 RepID=A0A072NHA4_SCHAZ|nr:DUF927 domain-containing protein [Schinkia azotoformans]KEF36288.1 DNA/RNA helicase, superfamily II [Schinkia azotoformans MEV2011]MEC1697872.1 DUF927 domain-containing protein [Schinkia azotoformans]MEC1723151.1 DUF927 domain-containing protein [Schinkia azotoformans]MEC1771875.1 DUF927 domain-containing protein [Schinkia azotoformans]MEC1780273.1 DUF927 domain-containing protein [Schinkia azotoformans]